MFDGLIIESGASNDMGERYKHMLDWSGPQRDEVAAAFRRMHQLVVNSLPPGCELGQELLAPFGTCDMLRGYRGPLLVLHGSADFIVPMEQARRNYEAATNARNREL